MSQVFGITSGGELADIYGNAPFEATVPTTSVSAPASPAVDEESAEDAYWRRLTRIEEERASREAEALRFKPKQDAKVAIRSVLAQYQLEGLADYIWDQYTQQLVDVSNESALIYSIKDQEAYKKRFSANQQRVANGLPELEPSTYLQLEDAYRNVLRNNGMPPGFYDSSDDFSAFIAGDVSVSELQTRVQEGYRVVQDADPEVKRQMQELYGIGEGELAAYFIDPNRARPLLVAADYQRQARAAQIAARGREQGGIQISGTLAEDLARRGVTAEEASRGFQEIGSLGELRQRFAGEDELSEERIVKQQFGVDPQAAEELERRRRRRVAEFSGGGGFVRTAGETSGSIRTGIGTAQ